MCYWRNKEFMLTAHYIPHLILKWDWQYDGIIANFDSDLSLQYEFDTKKLQTTWSRYLTIGAHNKPISRMWSTGLEMSVIRSVIRILHYNQVKGTRQNCNKERTIGQWLWKFRVVRFLYPRVEAMQISRLLPDQSDVYLRRNFQQSAVSGLPQLLTNHSRLQRSYIRINSFGYELPATRYQCHPIRNWKSRNFRENTLSGLIPESIW